MRMPWPLTDRNVRSAVPDHSDSGLDQRVRPRRTNPPSRSAAARKAEVRPMRVEIDSEWLAVRLAASAAFASSSQTTDASRSADRDRLARAVADIEGSTNEARVQP